MSTRRRFLLLAGGAALWVGGVRLVSQIVARPDGFDFVSSDRVAGFRTIATAGGASSSGGGQDFLVGLDTPAPLPDGMMERVAADPTAALFTRPARDGTTPVAYFFDYYCPYCRVLSGHLADLDRSGEIAVTRHHWPIFGAASEHAARATLAAEPLGGADMLHAQLMQTRIRVTPAYLEELVTASGLPWSDIAAGMHAPETDAKLQRSRAVSRLFGFAGTPSMVVGRTIVIGEIPASRLTDLVRLERAGGI